MWVFPATYLPRRLSARIRASDPYPSPRAVFVVSWAGMRGAVSLAAALALPLEPDRSRDRDLVIFLTFCVIVATLVGQGLSLPWVVRRLGVVATDGPDTRGGPCPAGGRRGGPERLDDLEIEFPGHKELVDQLRSRYEHEAGHVWPHPEAPRDEEEQELLDHLRSATRSWPPSATRSSALRDDGIIGDEVLRRIERDLDLEALRSGA